MSIDALVHGVRAADRTVLGRALSLVESTEPARQTLASELLERLLPWTGNSLRVGITGTPGAGKSTLIERLGRTLIDTGSRLAVLAVDPSSTISGGSILGDRTRMVHLSGDPRAFIRPASSGSTLGGVAGATHESILICEAAGFDVVLVETVGVGQSETTVAEMTDVFVALTIPGSGDELQGIKRGLFELVDVLLVNKADGDNAPRAEAAVREMAAVLNLWRPPDHQAKVLACSALTGAGIVEAWEAVQKRLAQLKTTGQFQQRRRQQDATWLESLLDARLRALFLRTPQAAEILARARREVLAGTTTPPHAVQRVFAAVLQAMRL